MVATYTLTGQVSNLVGDFDLSREALREMQGYVEASQPIVNDPATNKQRYGNRRLTFAADGTWSVSGLPATGSVVSAYRVVMFYNDGSANSQLVRVDSNWFSLTADTAFGSVVNVVLAPVDTTVLQSVYAARDAALAVGTTNDAVIAGRVNDSASATRAALGATFVRFVDLAGNPIAAHSVTIKVDTATGEIDDITYQGA